MGCSNPTARVEARHFAEAGYGGGVQVETLEQIAERLGWSPQRLAEAKARAAQPQALNISDRDVARAEALSESVNRTSQALDEAS